MTCDYSRLRTTCIYRIHLTATRLHPIPAAARPDKKPYLAGMGGRASFRPHHAATGGRHCRQIEIKMGTEETVHGRWHDHRGFMSPPLGMD